MSSPSSSKRNSTAKKTLNASQNHPLKPDYVPKSQLTGRANPIRELSQGAQNVMEYASGLHAASRKFGADDLPDHVYEHLKIGSESMHRTRTALNRGRANVYEDKDKFPEAFYRTSVGYQTFNGDLAQHASVAELMRAGNCDMHAAVNYTYMGAHMGKDSVAAKVVDPVAKHTFAELRASKTKTSQTDVVVDSWTSGKHAVIRYDTTFGRQMSPTAANTKKNFTEVTTTSGPGKAAFQRSQTQIALNKANGFQSGHDQAAKLPQNQVRPSGNAGMYAESPIMSGGGQVRAARRDQILQAGAKVSAPNKPLSGILRDLQRVQIARKMGASIGGAAKYVNKNK